MLAGMTSKELGEWEAYFALEPDPQWRADLRMGQVCSAILEPHRDPKVKPEPFTPSDFMHDFTTEDEAKEEAEAEQQSPKAQSNFFRVLASAGRGTFTPAPEAE